MMDLIIRLARKYFTTDVLGLVLVLIALQLFLRGITASLPNTDGTYFLAACVVAAILSLGLAKRKSKPYPAAAGMAALGAVGVWITGARLAIPLINLLNSAILVISQVIPALRSGTGIDASPVAEAWSPIVQASGALALRFQAWFLGLATNARVNDGLIRNVIWLFILWLMAAWMGWFTARRNATLALLPAMLLLAFVTSYSERRVEMLWGLVCVMLLLMGLWNYRNHTLEWETRKVDYAESIGFDNTVVVLLLAALIGLFAFITPSVSWRDMRDYFRPRHDNQLADALGVQEEPPRAITISLPKPVLPRAHLLSGGFALSEELVMTIRTGELLPGHAPSTTINAPRYYWRSVIYDDYVGAGWVTSSAGSQRYDANTPLIPGLLRGYKPLHLEVNLAQPEGKIFWSGTLFSADIPLTVRWRDRPTSNPFAGQPALLRADMFAATSDALSYTAEAYVPDLTIAELRAASTEYPHEIRDRYLKLPPELPGRVRKLAWQITAGETNPYDKAKAIESYLRSNYPYDLEIPAPPAGRDVTDYFLFDLKKGYCDYYATAMVVLARAGGLPARFVSGYAPGSYDALNAQYVVRELDAHSWAEVYFPEVGWVEFEPTASLAEIVLVADAAVLSPAAAKAQTEQAASRRLLNRFRLEQLGYFALPLMMVLLAGLLYFILIEPWWYLRQRSPSIAIERIYQKFYRAGRPLMGKRIRSETALEFSERMVDWLQDGFSKARVKGLYANTPEEIVHLTDLYCMVLFRNIPVHKQDLHAAWNAWRHIRWRLWVARIKPSRRFR